MEIAGPHGLTSKHESELTATIRRERTRLSDFIRHRVRISADAEDILQDVWHEFVEAYHLPAPIENASAWLFRVARNRITDLFRRRRETSYDTSTEDSSEEDAPRLDLMLPADNDGPEHAWSRSVLLAALQDAMDELPAEQREVFLAHELQGESFKTLAARAGVSINTLLARKRYAVLHLRSRLQPIYDELDM